ncbi:PerC family transcriptional regulator [Klebsiella pneumoniae]|uniref:PerC family transcriptional regulator n=1 Tax=Klebsiella pneumoniae TaxID=573 RepID=UPI001CC07FDE|nr:PerC family transcriptional regulator [Klebsiella pneumoniae]EKX7637445.1 PerC family transcriptional regulator [Klebsiella pneumoniae]ELA1308056.1 PerC family transcriptional regulator [Klebsiella pneumoniae]MBZ1696841.1 PerC family transcriptional regulator [Klebsiella pneumoniae]HDZ2531275.1 PerC family transcriptional regulator [Klebsiella pneumoniae]HDZ2539747.1 PerC family transcriptional regulator [Klebsiella pneumoniae]
MDKKQSIYELIINHIDKNPGIRAGEIKRALPQIKQSTVDSTLQRGINCSDLTRTVNKSGFYIYSVPSLATALKLKQEGAIEKYHQLCKKANELEGKGWDRRAALVWLEAFALAPTGKDRDHCAGRRRSCLYSTRSSEGCYLAGTFTGPQPIGM